MTIHLRQLLMSSASLMVSQLVTAGVGFVFWVVAARRFDEASIGFTSAAISAMSLLAAISTLGMGTLLIREMPLNRGREHRMITAALILSGGLGLLLGAAFVLLAPMISSEFAPMTQEPLVGLALVSGTALATVGLNADQALVGLLHSELQLMRNIVAAVGRLLLLLGASLIGWQAGRSIMLGSWSLALALSMGLLVLIALGRGRLRAAFPPAFDTIHFHRGSALQHHALNLAIQVPGWVMPLVTLIVLSAATNARFYLAWMLVGLASFIPVALTWSLYASASRDISTLRRSGRVTLGLSLVAACSAALFLWLFGPQVLSAFGTSYAVSASGPLPLLALTLIPVTIKSHFTVIHRVRGTLAAATMVVAAGGILEVVAATIGARYGDLIGLSLGLLVAMLLESIVMLPTVYEAIISAGGTLVPTAEGEQ